MGFRSRTAHFQDDQYESNIDYGILKPSKSNNIQRLLHEIENPDGFDLNDFYKFCPNIPTLLRLICAAIDRRTDHTLLCSDSDEPFANLPLHSTNSICSHCNHVFDNS